jgi:hypothetical protein
MLLFTVPLQELKPEKARILPQSKTSLNRALMYTYRRAEEVVTYYAAEAGKSVVNRFEVLVVMRRPTEQFNKLHSKEIALICSRASPYRQVSSCE